MPKNTHKKTDTKVPEPKFIRFGKVAKKCLNEVWVKTTNEQNDTMNMVLEELGVLEKIKQAPPGTVIVRTGDGPADILGVDILPPPPKPDPPEDPPVEDPKDIKPPEKKLDN